MKRAFSLQPSAFRTVALALGLCLLVLAVGAVTANPYEAIVGRNVFGLKPPTPVTTATPTPEAAAITFKLQGICTVLNRRQVILKVKTASRPPEPAKEKSYLWGEGQGEDNIEVLAIDAVTGTVKLKNRGETLSLTMKDDAEQPAAGPAAPAPATAAVPPVNPGGVPATGGSGRTIPTRSLRTPANDAAGAAAGPDTENLSPQQQMAAQRAPEETAALYEINRLKNEQLRQSGITLPRLPQHPMFKGGQ